MDLPKKISLAFGAKKPDTARKGTPINGTKRSRAALHDSDDEDTAEGKHEEVTHFDLAAGGAVDAKKVTRLKQPLVIPQPRKRQRSGLPSQDASNAEAAVLEANAQATPVTYGLNVTRRPAKDEEPAGNGQPAESVAPPKEKSLDQQAIDALMGKATDNGIVITVLTEEEVFHRDYEQAADVPTAADYDAVPIEEFGAALLRGMGWKEGETNGTNGSHAPPKPRTIERRPDLLGVGAKPAQSLGIELGEWGKSAKKHDKKIAKYMPVVLKNKKTGEMVTEEELKQKLKEQDEQQLMLEEERKIMKTLEYRSSKPSSRREEAYESSRKDRDYDSSSRKDRERRRDREKGYDDRKHHSSRRERSCSVETRRRRKDGNSDYDLEERKRRDKIYSVDERRSQEDDHEDRDRDYRRRERSSSPDHRHRFRKTDDRHRDYDRKYRDEENVSRKDKSDRDWRRHSHKRDRY